MTTVNVYLNFTGNCEEAFNFYKSIFKGDFTYIGRYGDMPPQEGMPSMPEEQKNKIMHISLPISNETMLMGADAMDGFGPPVVMGNNISLNVSVDKKSEADRIFKALVEGGQVTMPLADTFWGAYFGMTVDKFGINWMVNMENTPE